MIQIIEDNIFNSKEKYLAHQCNCVTNRAAHLAKDVFTKYPYANVYAARITPDTPGTISLKGTGETQRYVINCFGQYYPGAAKYQNDTYELRQKWFRMCLFEISKIENLESIAFPFGVGCGAAGGNWRNYFEVLEKFSNYVKERQGAKVFVYKLPGPILEQAELKDV